MSVQTLANSGDSKRRASLPVSLVFHGLFFAWLLHPSSPKFLAPSANAYGRYGTEVTELYWPNSAGIRNNFPGFVGREEDPASQRLHWRKISKARQKQQVHALPSTSDSASLAGNPSPGAPGVSAGTPYGTPGAAAFGDDIRPALPIHSFDPIVDPADLPGHVEGSIVVEITIDENGSIVSKTVLHSLGPAIDNKVLAALDNWHFRPATRNGVAIPSKQDVYYHFRPNG